MGASARKVQVWIHREGPAFLLLKLKPARGGFWQPVTGGVDAGESLEQAALREAREETGLEFRDAPRPLGHEFEYEKGGTRYHETAFALAASGTRVTLDPHEHVESRWTGGDEALGLLHFESNADALRKLMRSLSKNQGE